jgi:hypothetical protein
MATDPQPKEIPDAVLDEWYASHNGKAADGGLAHIGIEARDRLIRRLIDEVRRLRGKVRPPCELLCERPSTTTVKVILGQRWSPRCDEHTQ